MDTQQSGQFQVPQTSPQPVPVQQMPAQQPYAQPVPVQQMPAPAAVAPKPKKGWGKLVIALACVPLFIVGELAGMLIADALGLDDVGLNLLAEAGGAISVIIPCLILGGTKLLNITWDSWKIGWRALWWSIAISAGIAIYDLYCYIAEGELALVPDWPWQVFLSFIFCIFIGLFEEFMVRGLVLNGLLARMGTTRKGIFWACILSSVFFGLLHVDISRIGDVTTLELAQGVLKVLQTGMYGFALAAVVCKTGELITVSLLHGLDDWLLFILTFAMGESLETEYVSAGTEEGISTVIVYLVCIALYIPLIIKAVRILKDLDVPNRGAFFKEKSVNVAAPAPTGFAPAVPSGYAAPAAPQGYAATQQPAYQQTAAQQVSVQQPAYQPPAYQQPAYQPPAAPQVPAQPAVPANLIPTEIPEGSLYRTGQSAAQGEQIPPAR